MIDFEQQLQNKLLSGVSEKTFIDKLLSREDSSRIKDLISKNNLTRNELLELLYLLGGVESKLVNYDDWSRYIILKYFVWVRQFVKVCEVLFDYMDDIESKKISVTPNAKQLLTYIQRNLEHAAKFNIDLYLNIARTTLSLGATGFMEILNNKYEFSYPQGQSSNNQLPPSKTNFLGREKK